jgi:polyisoprenyl-phosphate glycosyltransferase
MVKIKIAAVIPAFNEEQTVAEVVRSAKASELIGEVIVVSDGSTDKTAEEARTAGADKVLELPENHGKGTAMLLGTKETSAEIIIFMDADVHGLTALHISQIVEPVLEGRRAMNVGTRDRGKFFSYLAMQMPLIGGERALRRSVIENIPKKYLKGFRAETALNYYCRVNNLPYGCVFLNGLHIRRKMDKVGFFLGLWGYFKMAWEIACAMFHIRLARARRRF